MFRNSRQNVRSANVRFWKRLSLNPPEVLAYQPQMNSHEKFTIARRELYRHMFIVGPHVKLLTLRHSVDTPSFHGVRSRSQRDEQMCALIGARISAYWRESL